MLPLFPLPNVVLFPGVFLPLHIFEPRYREMVADALATDRLIGMVLLRGGWEGEYEGRPPVFDVGCSGLITHSEKLADGRYNIILRGLDRFRIVSEDHTRVYRRAQVDAMHERELTPEDRATLKALRPRIEALVAPAKQARGIESQIASAIADDDLVNALAQYLDLQGIEKQALLELPSVPDRATALLDLLEMKALLAKHGPGNSHSH
ncbi:MAG TPA: LON peptidase substrate-binding domain-containing protein [Gemmatimonadaceae bacterium]